MANDLLQSQPISQLGIQLLIRQLVLMRTVSMVPGGEFAGPSGGTVTLRVPMPRAARTQTPGDPITFDDVEEVSVDVSLAHLYNAAKLTDEDLHLGISDFGAQVLRPAVSAVATGAEATLAAVMNGLAADIVVSADEAVDAVLDARQALSEADVPTGGRWLAVSPSFATGLLGDDRLARVDASGNPSALRDAVLGTLWGFRVVESNALAAGTAVAYHASAFGAAVRAPARAAGADSTTASEQGIALRIVRDFNINSLSEVMAVSTFAGAALVTEDGDTPGTDLRRAVAISIEDGDTSS